MLVSNFEILINRITVGPPSPLNRRVVQGYFLSITNLDSRDLNLNVTVTSSKSTAGLGNGTDINRDFIPVTNTVMIADNAPIAQNNVVLTLVQTGTAAARAAANVFRTTNMPVIKSNQTALVTIFPNPALAASMGTNLEIRGYVGLNLVPNADGSTPAPYKVMLSAEQRGTFLDDKLFMGLMGPYDFDQIAYSLSLASGKAENTLAD